jgi:hypothetical protein
MDGMQTYHVASLVHPLFLLEAEMFSTVQEDLKNEQMTIFMHFNQMLNSDECPGKKKGEWFVALVPLMITLQFAVQQLKKSTTNLASIVSPGHKIN